MLSMLPFSKEFAASKGRMEAFSLELELPLLVGRPLDGIEGMYHVGLGLECFTASTG